MQTQSRRILDFAAAQNILSSRLTLVMSMIGIGSIIGRVQGNGNFLPASDPSNSLGQDKWIHNLKANSSISMAKPENKKLLADAIAADKAAKAATDAAEKQQYAELADELFNKYLNNVQVSFNSIGSAKRFNNGDTVTFEVELVDTKSGDQQLVVRNVTYKAPTVIAATKFSLEDLAADEAVVDLNATVQP